MVLKMSLSAIFLLYRGGQFYWRDEKFRDRLKYLEEEHAKILK
jgi:hypothetical protein